MRILKSKAMRFIVITVLILIALGLLTRALPIWPSLWAWAIAHPTEAQIILGVLAFIATVVGIIVAILYGRYQRQQWELEKERDIRERISERLNFPFEAVTPEELPGKFPTLPLADQTIGYLHRLPPEEQEAMQHLLDNATRLLIRGRTGLGKTREAIALVQRLAAHKREPITVLLPKSPLTPPPFIWPPDLPTRTIVLFLDRVEENWGFAAPEGKEKIEALAAGDLRGWLPQAVAYLEERFKGSDFRVIATVRDDPIELWERIEPDGPFWRGFTVYRLPDWEESQREELCRRTADWQEIGEVEEEAGQLIVQRCDGTPASIITFLKGHRGVERLSLAEARQFDGRYPNDWERIWREKIAPYPAARYLFAALSILNQARMTPYKYLAVRLAARLWDEHLAWQREPEVEGRYGLKWVESWVVEEKGVLKCPEAYLEGKGDLRANAALLTDLLLAASREEEHMEELLPSLFNLGYILQVELADQEGAIKAYSRVVELDPRDHVTYSNRGVAYADKAELVKKPEERLSLLDLAIADYSEAIAIKPDYEAAFYNRGSAYADKAELVEEPERPSLLDKAIADYSEAIAIKPDDEAAFNNRGLAYYKKAELVEEPERLSLLDLAIADYTQAIGIKPDLAEAHANRGFARIDKAELKAEPEARADVLQRAVEDCERALELGTPDDALVRRRLAYAYSSLGNVHYDAKRYEDALAAYHRITQLEPRYATYWNALGNALYALNRYEDALKPYTKAIELAEDKEAKAMYFRNRADTFIKLERLEEAGEDLEKARELEPENPYLFAHYGQLYLWQEEFEQAVTMCREAQKRGLKEAWVQLNLALATLCQGKLEEARKEYGRGVEMADREDLEGAIEDLERMLAKRPGLEGAEEIMEMLREARERLERGSTE